MKGKENYRKMENNSAKFVKLKENMRGLSFKISCVIDNKAVFRTQSHIQDGTLSLMLDSLQVSLVQF